MRQLFESQKLLRDVYAKFYTFWNLHDFKKFKKTKQEQLSILLTLLDKYDLEPPVSPDSYGAFANSKHMELYTNFIKTGRFSLFEALRSAATMEDLNIYSSFDCLHKTDNRDLRLICRTMTETSRDNLQEIKDLLGSYGEKLGGNIWMW
ncbi:MAG: DUF2202 domain-containing protein [Desulfohalobiaceae bacterium]|nr:DUF2202 domain-containing protein [Desulfohalobiaceae bacterium]